MYNRAKSSAQQLRADNRHNIPNRDNTAELERFPSRARGPAAAATAPAWTKSSPDHATNSGTGSGTAAPDHAGPVRSTLLQPRVAVALGVSKTWYPLLFLCRLVSIAPGVLFGLPTALRLLATLHLMYLDRVLDGGALRRVRGGSSAATSGYDPAFEARLRLTETMLATIWVRHAHPRSPIRTSHILTHALNNSASHQATSPSSSLTASCRAGCSTTPRKPPSSAS
jgi:hypothetical protein